MKRDKNPLISIVILNWNRLEDTLACIESVKSLEYTDVEFIVVDNGSVDGSKEKLKAIEGIILVDNPKNRGFTGGHIDGFAVAKGEFILLLNNDAVIAPDYIHKSLETLLIDDSVGAIGGRAYMWTEGSKAYDTTLPFYAYQNINPITAEGLFVQSDEGQIKDVNNLSGSGVIVRRSVIDRIGYLYEPFFAYYEETDLFARMKRADYRVVYDPRLSIWHKSGASSSSYFQFNQLFKNRFTFAIRNFEKGFLLPFLRTYVRTGLKSTLMRIRNSENKDLHRGFSNAFLYSLFMWPNAFASRLRLTKELGHNTNSYNSLLYKEQLLVSLVFNVMGVGKDLKQYVNKIEAIKEHYGHLVDIILVVDAKQRIKSTLRITKTTEIFSNQGNNLGWLSAKGDFVIFIEEVDPSSINFESLLESAAKLSKESAWLAHDNVSHTPVHKDLLIHAGGLNNSTSFSENLKNLCLFAYYWNPRKIIVTRKNLSYLENTLDASKVKEIKRNVHIYKNQDKPPSRSSEFFIRHYLINHQVNILKFIVTKHIRLRSKLARLTKLFGYGITLRRSKFGTELLHIRNELFKATHMGINIERQNKLVKAKLIDAKINNSWKNIPVFIICRDRLNDLHVLVRKLETLGMQNIIFIDNDSIYPPLINFFFETDYQVIHTGENVGHTVPWTGGITRTLVPEELYIVTDPDVIPSDDCPNDFIIKFINIHLKYFAHQKVGFGLKIDDLPDSYNLKQAVIKWESQFWNRELESGIYEAGVDTTFALYKPFMHSYTIHPSIRTGEPYTAHHLPWYVDSGQINSEEQFYRARVDNKVTSWNVDEVAERYKVEFTRMKRRVKN